MKVYEKLQIKKQIKTIAHTRFNAWRGSLIKIINPNVIKTNDAKKCMNDILRIMFYFLELEKHFK
jgi:hypothetical protein